MPVMPGVEFVRFNDVAALRAQFSDEVCAICVEAIQGEGGIRPVSQEFFAAARELTRSTGALLIVDEIQAGMGRTGKWCAYQHYGIQPDITTLAKPLAGGLPLGAMLCTEEVASAMQPGMHGTTFGGGPLACAVAIAVIDTMKREEMLGAYSGRGRLLPSAACPPGCAALRHRQRCARHRVDARARTPLRRHCKVRDRCDDAETHSHQPHQRNRAALSSALHPRQVSMLTLPLPHLTKFCTSTRLPIAAPHPKLHTQEPPLEAPQLAANASLLKPVPYSSTATGPFALAAKSLAGNDLCSIADLSAGEIAALLKLAHAVKARPRDYRHALDAKQMVMFFEKASLRTRLTFETAINTLGGNAIFVDQTQSPLGERESLADIARNVERWSDGIVLRTYAHDTITEMAADAAVPVINALSDLEHPARPWPTS